MDVELIKHIVVDAERHKKESEDSFTLAQKYCDHPGKFIETKILDSISEESITECTLCKKVF